jgi:hypothetical protein
MRPRLAGESALQQCAKRGLCEAPARGFYPEIAVPSASATLFRVFLPRVRFDLPEGLARASVMIE